ncbi:calcium-binding protein NCS-1-like [Gigantopelta aegis]|uniref:calcium-binding protein NCS-1-like n=1 Tax=Gigantopelta aegis TaxID=1735272 RepID=UPI001B888DE9|nr:calcium-binding protein NCS-1-like [Gigantopelta aegis]
MGNQESALSVLSREELNELMNLTPFNQRELEKLLSRYASFDTSERGTNGILYQDVLSIPEFSGNKFAPHVIMNSVDDDNRIYPKQFLMICALFSTRTSPSVKKDSMFQLFDEYNTGVFTHDEMFRIYKILFDRALSDDHILDLTFKALRHPDLARQGQITKEEFIKMIPDNEIMARLSIDFELSR